MVCRLMSRIFLVVVNVVALLLGGLLMYMGIQLAITQASLVGATMFNFTIVSIVTAVAVIIGSVVGLAGAKTEKKRWLGCYLIFVVSAMVVLGMVGGVMFKGGDQVLGLLDKFVDDQYHMYGNDTSSNNPVGFNSTEYIDFLQSRMHCCGMKSYKDWDNLPYHDYNVTSVPLSCCNSTMMTNTTTCSGMLPQDIDLIYHQGCEEVLNEEFKHYFDLVKWIVLTLLTAVFLTFIITIVLMFKRPADADPFNYVGYTAFDNNDSQYVSA